MTFVIWRVAALRGVPRSGGPGSCQQVGRITCVVVSGCATRARSGNVAARQTCRPSCAAFESLVEAWLLAHEGKDCLGYIDANDFVWASGWTFRDVSRGNPKQGQCSAGRCVETCDCEACVEWQAVALTHVLLDVD